MDFFGNMLNYAIWRRLCINDELLSELKEELNNTMGTQSKSSNLQNP
jgi:hypothetical protein